MPETTLPDANFLNFLSGLGGQALMQLGAVPMPDGTRAVNLPYARYSLQLLRVLEAKTAGNLTTEEAGYLSNAIADVAARLERAEG